MQRISHHLISIHASHHLVVQTLNARLEENLLLVLVYHNLSVLRQTVVLNVPATATVQTI